MMKLYKTYGALSVNNENAVFDILESIKKHIEQLRGEIRKTSLLSVSYTHLTLPTN